MAELAAALERIDRAEVQLRTAADESVRLAARVQQLELELADARRDLAKSREETIAVTSLATAHGTRAADLEREMLALRERAYQLELDVTSMAAERDRVASEFAVMYTKLTDTTTARAQLTNQLEEAMKQHSRALGAAAAADDRHKAEMQQLQVRLAAAEGECRALHHGKGTMHEDLQRTRADILALQLQLQEESRRREEQASENRRLQRELEVAAESLTQAQRSQRSAAAVSDELEEELERLRMAHGALEAELQVANERMQRLQDESRAVAERNAELTGQINSMTAALRHLESENARLGDGHAALRIEIEARAAEARAARGEAAELAADRARLLAELQKTSAQPPDEDEATRLRAALSAAKLEVARLQKELAANDAVLADAESALVALVSEKEGLQQALSVALISERVAIDTAEELKSQVAALASQGSIPDDPADKAAAMGEATLEVKGVDQRMISYLQSLRNDGTAAHPSESGHDQSSAATPGVGSVGPHSVASSVAGPLNVRITGPTGPARAALRYPARHPLSASESGSTLPPYRPGGNNDPWEALSASGTDNSANQTGSGETLAAGPTAGLASAVVVTSMASRAAHAAPARAKDARLMSSAEIADIGGGSTCSAGAAAVESDNSGAQATTFSLSRATSLAHGVAQLEGPGPGVITFGQDDIAAEACAAPATSLPSTGATSGQSSLLTNNPAALAALDSNFNGQSLRGGQLPPRSPCNGVGEVHDVDTASAPTSGLGHVDKGPQSHAFSPAKTLPNTMAAGATLSPSLTAVYMPLGNRVTTPTRSQAGSSAMQAAVSTSPLETVRSLHALPANLVPYQSLQNVPSASESPSAGNVHIRAIALSSEVPAPPGAPVPAVRQHDMASPTLAGRQLAAAEAGVTLQTGMFRSPMRASLMTPRIGFMGGALGGSGPDDHGVASRPASVGGTGAGSPMISPRVMLEGRMLSKAVRPSTDALSTPLRLNHISPGAAIPEEQAPSASPHGPIYSENTVRRASRLQGATSLASGAQLEPPPPQSYPKASSAGPSLQPEVGGFPSPFASGSAAAVIASPRSSVTVGVAVPSQPAPASNMDNMEGMAQQRVTRDQQAPNTSPTPPRPSMVLSFARRSTITPEVGFTGGEATLGTTAADDRYGRALNVTTFDAMYGTAPTGNTLSSPRLLAQQPSEEDATLLKRLAAMDEALRAIGAM